VGRNHPGKSDHFPTRFIDVAAVDRVSEQALTDRLVRELGSTALMVTHNLDQALGHGDRLVMLQDGQLLRDWAGSERQGLTADYLSSLYGSAKVPPSQS
jgi:putative ABC transport system ATP-binding protein